MGCFKSKYYECTSSISVLLNSLALIFFAVIHGGRRVCESFSHSSKHYDAPLLISVLNLLSDQISVVCKHNFL